MPPVDYLYSKNYTQRENSATVLKLNPFSCKCPLGSLPGETLDVKTFLARLWFKLITAGNFQIFYTKNENGVITHTSYVLGPCFKFPFMGANDYEIGPCVTHPNYRGRGIYPMVLEYITSTVEEGKNFYMLVKSTNSSSIRGIEKAGFTRIGQTQKTKFKRYVRIK